MIQARHLPAGPLSIYRCSPPPEASCRFEGFSTVGVVE